LGIDRVVLSMRSDKSDVYESMWIVDANDYSISIVGYVESDAPISKDSRDPELLFHIAQLRPIRPLDMAVPGKGRTFRVAVLPVPPKHL
jgi:hypothetical protein